MTDPAPTPEDDAARLDPAILDRLKASFESQGLMRHLGARLVHAAPGHVVLRLPYRPELGQQLGYFHAGASAAIADSAGGYAAFSLFPAGHDVLTTEFKLNLLNPAQGEWLEAEGRVIKPGRTLTICRLEVHALHEGRRVHVATGLQTLIRIADRGRA